MHHNLENADGHDSPDVQEAPVCGVWDDLEDINKVGYAKRPVHKKKVGPDLFLKRKTKMERMRERKRRT